MKRYLIIIAIALGLPFVQTKAQQEFRVMSYNVENLFDASDDPNTDDNDFLPEGKYNWTDYKYHQKLERIAQVITAAGEWSTPALVALCEVENDSVLWNLSHRTQLQKQNYSYVITNGPDKRGINVGLLYQRDKFAFIGKKAHRVHLQGGLHSLTRDLLHVWGRVISGDTLDVFVCHFPSRSGGEKESETDRIQTAQQLRRLCDSLVSKRKKPQIILMGDFNDTPANKSIKEVLNAGTLLSKDIKVADGPKKLYDLFANPKLINLPGSHKYHGEWSQLDHIIVNASLLKDQSSMRLVRGSMRVFSPSFLLTTDKQNTGEMPLRTFSGFKYNGGFSDHLPLIADFTVTGRKR
jgi:predicted extracellular nuclease